MEVKGTAIKSVIDYVKQMYPNRYDDWVEALPQESQLIISKQIMPNEWYELMPSIVYPTRIIGELFFDGDTENAAIMLGRYSAEVALKGIYKIFVRVSSAQFIISRSAQVFSTYYKPAKFQIEEKTSNSVKVKVSGFSDHHFLVLKRIEGYIAQTLEIVGRKEIHAQLTLEKSDEGLIGYISSTWND